MKIDSQGAPLVLWNFRIHSVTERAALDWQGRALPLDRLVEHHVVLKRVCSDDVIVVRICESEYDAARLILLAADGSKFHFNEPILDLLVGLCGPGESRLTGLL